MQITSVAWIWIQPSLIRKKACQYLTFSNQPVSLLVSPFQPSLFDSHWCNLHGSSGWSWEWITSVFDSYLVFHVVDQTSLMSENHSMGQAILDLPVMETQPTFHTTLHLADLVVPSLSLTWHFISILSMPNTIFNIFSTRSVPHRKFQRLYLSDIGNSLGLTSVM